jgi:hypothetical protein
VVINGAAVEAGQHLSAFLGHCSGISFKDNHNHVKLMLINQEKLFKFLSLEITILLQKQEDYYLSEVLERKILHTKKINELKSSFNFLHI